MLTLVVMLAVAYFVYVLLRQCGDIHTLWAAFRDLRAQCEDLHGKGFAPYRIEELISRRTLEALPEKMQTAQNLIYIREAIRQEIGRLNDERDHSGKSGPLQPEGAAPGAEE